jgi:DNA mismatch repair protein MutS
VAKLAGVPDSVITRAKEIVEELSANDINDTAERLAEKPAVKRTRKKKLDDVDIGQISLFDNLNEDELTDELLSIDISTLTPIEALNKLFELQNRAKEKS